MSNTPNLSEIEQQLAFMRAQQMATFVATGQLDQAARSGLSVLDTPAYLYLKSNLVTQDPVMLELFLDVAILYVYTYESKPPILITGESGTGKETFARAFAQGLSNTNTKLPFVGINCTSLPDYLVESELFGHKKGAFTGALDDRAGLLQTAGHGVVLIDEIGDMPINLQPKLLRVLQERTIRRVGSNEEIPIHCRIVCATHKDLEDRVNKNKFREDLLWRISSYRLNIPPLRERRDDAILFLKQPRNQDITGTLLDHIHSILLDPTNELGGNYRELQSYINSARLNMWRTAVRKSLSQTVK
jgi:transcriptional regulator with GAF, ATPase, and Fis domain